MKEKGHDIKRAKVIDIHCHAAGVGARRSGCYISPAMRRSWKYGIYLRAFGVTEPETNEKGDSLIIERISQKLAYSTTVDSAVVLAIDCVIGEDGEPDLAHTEMSD